MNSVRYTILTMAVLAALAPTCSQAQSKFNGIPPEQRKYTLGDGVVQRDITFYSDGVACFGRIFYPKNFDPKGKTPAVVAAQGWTGFSDTIHKYGNRFAENGLVAMTIDYRGWGESDGFVSMADRVKTTDDQRFTDATTKIRIKRTRLLPMGQVDDIRNAISYIQGEAGVDPARIGIWGSSYAGGHVLTIASIDPRVSAVVSQVTGLNGYGQPKGPLPYTKAETDDAVMRARTGQGGEFNTGYSTPRNVDLETQRLAKEYRPYNSVELIPESVAVLFLLAGKDELINNERAGKAAYALLKGPKKLVEYPGIGHFDMYIEDNFEKGSKEAVAWYRKYLKMD